MTDALARLIAAMQRDLADVTAARSYLGAERWQTEMQRVLTEYHAAAYLLGSSEGMTPGAARVVRALIARQTPYLQGFAQSLDTLSDAQATARALMYAGALKASYSRGQFRYWDLPAHPSEGSPCGNNCHCAWQINVLNLEELDADCYWVMGGSEHCGVCVQRAAAWAPLSIRGGIRQ